MREREPYKEIVGPGELFFLSHPDTEIFSGYGLTMRPGTPELLVGVLMVDRPRPVDPEWLQEVEAEFGEYQLVAMTASGDRGIVCQMQIDPESLPFLRQFPGERATAVHKALKPLVENPPKPAFVLHWDEEARAWCSRFATSELPPEICEAFERSGYGCLAAESNIGVVHICHAADQDIDGFRDKPVSYQWQLVKMPSAPLVRFEIAVHDQPDHPYLFESFLNVDQPDQLDVLCQLANQDELYLAFYGDNLSYRFTKVVPQDRRQWQYIDELMERAIAYWNEIPPAQRDFDRAKADFMGRHP